MIKDEIKPDSDKLDIKNEYEYHVWVYTIYIFNTLFLEISFQVEGFEFKMANQNFAYFSNYFPSIFVKGLYKFQFLKR
jgi:hypothetical protein